MIRMTMEDIQPHVLVVNSTHKSSSYGRYTAQRWVFKVQTKNNIQYIFD